MSTLFYGVFVCLCWTLAGFSYWGGYRAGKTKGFEEGKIEGFQQGYSKAIEFAARLRALRDSAREHTWPPTWGGDQ